MGLVRKLRRFASRWVGREYAIRYRLLRSSLRSIRAERSADVLLVSYPKCGRTWLRVMLSRALELHTGLRCADYLANEVLGGAARGLPRIRISHDDNPHWKTPRQLTRSKRRYRDKKVVLLVRDPRDVVVSMYFERTRRERAYTGTLEAFLREPKGSLATIIAYYNVWAAARTTPRAFCLVRYEDLRADPVGQVGRLLQFAGVPDVSAEHVAEAVEFAAFDNMRAMEKAGALGSGRLRPRDSGDLESFKTRRGKVGGYVDYLSPGDVQWMDARLAALDPSYGYGEPAAGLPQAVAAGSGPP